MQLKKLFKDDDAVSPVIGVILMVAITVILAAVIASFVLGLGDAADEVQPNTNFALDDVSVVDDGGNDESALTVTLTDGDSIDFEEIVLRGSALNEDVPEEGTTEWDDDTWNTGQSVEISPISDDFDPNGLDWDSGNHGEEVTLNIVWEEAGGDNSATLASYDFELVTDTP